MCVTVEVRRNKIRFKLIIIIKGVDHESNIGYMLKNGKTKSTQPNRNVGILRTYLFQTFI